MAKRRSYEDKLFDDLKELPANKWFKCPVAPEYDKFIYWVKVFIDSGEQYEFSADYTKIKRLCYKESLPVYHKMKAVPEGITIVAHLPGEEVIFEHRGREIIIKRESKAWSIFYNEKLIAIETSAA